ncbi:MAG: CDP-alcohol phosphatidyltransferase family protein [Granulosicoccus sp.]|nr:CDP-alcohol phosphatidyltransferase family protein [Granulosicoccus sp.]
MNHASVTAPEEASGQGPNTAATPGTQLRRQALICFSLATVVLLAAMASMQILVSEALGTVPSVKMFLLSCGMWAAITALSWRGLGWHEHAVFGPANIVTMFRAAGTALLAGSLPLAEQLLNQQSTQLLWLATAFAIVLLALDGVDGYLARISGIASVFGARLDMEIDALLALVISVFIWLSGEVGMWILGLGIMRYVFLLAALQAAPLRGKLYPSWRRKTVCVIQLATLCAILSPVVEPPLSAVLGQTALVLLSMSFARDVLWLYQHQPR